MATRVNYHNYFISLEDRFVELSKYIEIDERNYNTFSTEIALLFMATCSEFEVVSKELCSILLPNSKIDNIKNIFKILQNNLPEIFEEEIVLNRHDLIFQPLKDWTIESPPNWWRYYNKVKHHRSTDYDNANLLNLTVSLSALQLVNFYYLWQFQFKNKSRNAPPMGMNTYPRIFELNNVTYDGPRLSSDVFDI